MFSSLVEKTFNTSRVLIEMRLIRRIKFICTRKKEIISIIMILISITAFSFLIIYFSISNQIDSLKSELQQKSMELTLRVKRYEFIPYSLATSEHINHFLIKEVKTSTDYESINSYLSSITKQTRALALYLLDEKANVIASSDEDINKSAIGYNLSHRPYFQIVQPGKTIGYYGVGISNSVSGYYQANGIFINGVKKGVIVAKINLNQYLKTHSANYHTVLLDRDNIVAFSSNPEWFYHTIRRLSSEENDSIIKEKRYYDHKILGLDVKREITLKNQSGIAYVNNVHYVYHYRYIPAMEMMIVGVMPLKKVALNMLPLLLAINLAWALIIVFLYVINQRNQIIKLKQEKQDVLESTKERLETLVHQRTNELFKRTTQLEAEVKEREATEAVLRNTQQELLQKEKLAVIGQLSAGLAHEINQPLAAISMMSANALKLIELGAADEAKDNLERLIRSVDFIGQLSNQLRSFSRTGDDIVGPVSVKASVDNSMLLISHRFKRNNCQFIRLSPDVDIWCMCNNIRLQQVIVNILNNALDAILDSNSERFITANWYSDNEYAVIEFEDSGMGIPPENLKNIFEPFFTTKKNHGLGLGLSISAEIIKSYNGLLTATNGKQGACFILRLPLVKNN
ncbi:C4-dicarboxylate transport sensor protein dctB (plasmid) [Enterobacter cancerogenus]|nr:C4-dicarboxylate transport sensor protein dctB [Enterobacter cancerogenus]